MDKLAPIPNHEFDWKNPPTDFSSLKEIPNAKIDWSDPTHVFSRLKEIPNAEIKGFGGDKDIIASNTLKSVKTIPNKDDPGVCTLPEHQHIAINE